MNATASGLGNAFAATLAIEGTDYRYFDLPALADHAGVSLSAIPFAARVLLESLLRGGEHVAAIEAARRIAAGERAVTDIAFRPARLLMQDYTGIPALVDLAAMRDRVGELGGDAGSVNPVVATDVVVDHSLLVEHAGSADALRQNEAIELERNHERYGFLRWAERNFDNLRVVPPGQGIVHQVNLEMLASVVAMETRDGVAVLFPDSVIGTDSHTTMANGLGVLGWGVGGLEAESIMLGMPIRTALPEFVGVHLDGSLRPGVTATDAVLTLTAFLRREGVVGAMVEFTGPAVARLGTADRCTIANMAPEYGAMGAFFPVDAETVRYLRQTGRPAEAIARVEAYCHRQQLWRDQAGETPRYRRLLQFDLATVVASVAGPNQPHQRVDLDKLRSTLPGSIRTPAAVGGGLADGAIVLASITSCTNTSNPMAMLAAGRLAERAVARGLRVPAHVKTSLAPGSRAVTRYLEASGLLASLQALGFHVVGYACAACNGGGGPLLPEVAAAVERDGIHAAAVLSGNRNFEGRVHRLVRANYLASPALVVALALAGTVAIDLEREPLGIDAAGEPVYLHDLWPDDADIHALVEAHVRPALFSAAGSAGTAGWRALPVAGTPRYPWREDSTYIRQPPYFNDGDGARPVGIHAARALLLLGDNISTDHISPVGGIAPDAPAGRYLAARGIQPVAFNNYGSRRSNHEIMARATFANERLRNRLLPGSEGGNTVHLPSGEIDSVFDVAMRYLGEGTPLVVIADANYGVGSSRDWAARGPWFLGVRAVIARSFERIHRSNLVAMGILPVELAADSSAESLGLDGREHYDIAPVSGALAVRSPLRVSARRGDGSELEFTATARIDSADELAIFRRGGMLPHLLDHFRAGAGRGEEILQ